MIYNFFKKNLNQAFEVSIFYTWKDLSNGELITSIGVHLPSKIVKKSHLVRILIFILGNLQLLSTWILVVFKLYLIGILCSHFFITMFYNYFCSYLKIFRIKSGLLTLKSSIFKVLTSFLWELIIYILKNLSSFKTQFYICE